MEARQSRVWRAGPRRSPGPRVRASAPASSPGVTQRTRWRQASGPRTWAVETRSCRTSSEPAAASFEWLSCSGTLFITRLPSTPFLGSANGVRRAPTPRPPVWPVRGSRWIHKSMSDEVTGEWMRYYTHRSASCLWQSLEALLRSDLIPVMVADVQRAVWGNISTVLRMLFHRSPMIEKHICWYQCEIFRERKRALLTTLGSFLKFAPIQTTLHVLQ